MYFNSSVFANSLSMFGGWVAFVGIPAVVWVLFVVFEHKVVSSGFGQYGGCGYVEVFAITTNDAVVRNVLVGLEFIAVYDDGFWYTLHGCYGKLHGLYRSI